MLFVFRCTETRRRRVLNERWFVSKGIGQTLTCHATEDEDSDSTQSLAMSIQVWALDDLVLSANSVLKFAARQLCWAPARQYHHFESTVQR